MRTRMTAVGLLILQVCFAETVSPWPMERNAIDQACEAAIRGSNRAEAIQTMEDIAEGKPLDIILAAAERAGLKAYFGERLMLVAESVRAYAAEALGRTGLPDAIRYLNDATPETFGNDRSQSIYPTAKIALQKALLRGESDVGRQTALLEGQLSERYTAMWAAEELCDRGSSSSITRIQQTIERHYSGERVDGMVSSCRERMSVVNRNPDRAKALGTVLRVDAKRDQIEIMRWSVHQLLAMHSKEAREILERYATEAEQSFPDVVPSNSSRESEMHRGFAQEIRRKYPRDNDRGRDVVDAGELRRES